MKEKLAQWGDRLRCRNRTRKYKIQKQDPAFSLVYVGTALSNTTARCHPRAQSTDFHGAAWTDTTSAAGSGTVGCSPNKDTRHIPRSLSRAQSPYCSQFPRLLTKYNWHGFCSCQQVSHSRYLSRPCRVKHHSQYFNACPERRDSLTFTYSFSRLI